ncbi:NAD(P)H-dependent glycerol-3-phosphate dehydrogenase [Sideroxydans lithotrophicus]|uniref:Glycerol-3-phosphate dehydrogenase [NAD(P)+] n=1 Tax=Sideroxydans lithotrophicus (strain ES-1) TaxID=580332 RepID=D5CND8_SIDLE|nr:NAD(P)H-dependent glycerol-3-phosphate dehydrogenase [Sideroxydans lithotrophicus]ADE12835.1 Glycerol-3-phosphate dehydrogenase (NAD(P)(+)) [Sideroxydans lithotrophicus ES-1]
MKVAILGSGAWGTALAVSFAPRHQVTLWARDTRQIEAMRGSRRNQRYLPGIDLPVELKLSADLDEALTGVELVLVAVPVAALRSTLRQIARLPSPVAVIWVCKGFESETSQLPHQIVTDILPPSFPRGVLSGPSFAQEVARHLPTALTLASSDGEFAQHTAKNLHHSRLRIYSSTDVVGVEIGGAVKNVLAIAAGICDGMQMGFNARAAMLTRGLAEMTRLGLQMGGRAETLGGLSGVGDLILTCTGDLSRNRQVGMLLAQHKSLSNILNELGHVAEGVYTAREVHLTAQRLGVDMPICEAVYRVLYENLAADKAVEALLSRQPGNEFD